MCFLKDISRADKKICLYFLREMSAIMKLSNSFLLHNKFYQQYLLEAVRLQKLAQTTQYMWKYM